MNREPFEKWLLEEHGLQSEWQPERNCYKDFPAHLAWKAWQAALLPEVGATARLRTIEGRLNGIANAMASCPGFAPIPQQLTYWREVVEEAYDLARDAGSPQSQEGK